MHLQNSRNQTALAPLLPVLSTNNNDRHRVVPNDMFQDLYGVLLQGGMNMLMTMTLMLSAMRAVVWKLRMLIPFLIVKIIVQEGVYGLGTIAYAFGGKFLKIAMWITVILVLVQWGVKSLLNYFINNFNVAKEAEKPKWNETENGYILKESMKEK